MKVKYTHKAAGLNEIRWITGRIERPKQENELSFRKIDQWFSWKMMDRKYKKCITGIWLVVEVD